MTFNPLYSNIPPLSYQYPFLSGSFYNSEPFLRLQRKSPKPFVNVLQNIHISSPYLMNYNYYMCNCNINTNKYMQPLYSVSDEFNCETQETTKDRNAFIAYKPESNEHREHKPIQVKPNEENENASQSTCSASCSVFLGKKRRIRKNKSQINQLNMFYKENKIWTKGAIQKISEETGLKENKVYKWLWDQKNKDLKNAKFYVNK